MKNIFAMAIVCLCTLATNAQFTHQDTLMGSNTPERVWWNLQHYTLSIEVFPDTKSIVGTNTVEYTCISTNTLLQIDLQAPLTLTKAIQNGQVLRVTKDGSTHFIALKEKQVPGKTYTLTLEYSGKPHAAINAPWDGGFSWETANKKPFIATSCQGIGASIWWPCKDYMGDEPEKGIIVNATVPKGLVAVSNGRLIKQTVKGPKETFTWQIRNPINSYGVNLNIGNYTNFSEVYNGAKGNLDLNFWVLKSNLEKAKKHFLQANKTIEALEHWFGPYPFYEDGYKLVEVPYLGMEHQSSVTYGNGYKNGYLGSDLSGTGWGLKFDFIIVHESGHEWFANNITYKDVADMWIHESFTCYSESLFLEYYYDKKAAAEYIRGQRSLIENKEPLIAHYGVREQPTSDVYFKGSNMLHTLRQWTNNDSIWRTMLRGLNETFYHKTVSTKDIENYIAKVLNLKLEPFFDQYLRTANLPTFEYRITDNTLSYRWTNCVEKFNLPIKITVNGDEILLNCLASQKAQTLEFKEPIKSIEIDPNYYVSSLNILAN